MNEEVRQFKSAEELEALVNHEINLKTKLVLAECPGVADSLSVRVDTLDMVARAATLTFRAYLQKRYVPAEKSRIVTPRSWWQMLKRDHFPALLMKWFPVKVREQIIEVQGPLFICPHVGQPKERHDEFLSMTPGLRWV